MSQGVEGEISILVTQSELRSIGGFLSSRLAFSTFIVVGHCNSCSLVVYPICFVWDRLHWEHPQFAVYTMASK